MAASSSRGLEFCEDKQIWLIKKNYEDNKCNIGVKSGIMEEAACIKISLGCFCLSPEPDLSHTSILYYVIR